MKHSTLYTGIFLLLLSAMVASCNKFLDLAPPKSAVEADLVFSDDVTATSAVLNIYVKMHEEGYGYGGDKSIIGLCGLSADELTNVPQNDPDVVSFETNTLHALNPPVLKLWQSLYQSIYRANLVVEGLSANEGVTAATRDQLIGECLFMRAFCHFYLVNLFGDVPLVLTTDYERNRLAVRTPVDEVYEQVLKDFLQARELMAPVYSALDKERIRPNKFAASAMAARVYLYRGNHADAEAMASEVIGHTELYRMKEDLNEVFLKNSTEAIWQLRPLSSSGNGVTGEAGSFAPDEVPDKNELDSAVVRAFEPGDNRFLQWVDTLFIGDDTLYHPVKYKQFENFAPMTEYSMILRLAEMFLVRAEARAMQDKLTGANSAQSDINEIRHRAGLPNTAATTQPQLLAAIVQERRIELLTEWGHRWLDLKRTGQVVPVLGALKAGFTEEDELYPIPTSEMNRNPKLVRQNPGY